MSVIKKISSSSDNIIYANYRMPGNNSPILEVAIQPRALLNDVAFPSEVFFEEWSKQNSSFLESGLLVVGSATEKQLKAKQKENTVSAKKAAVEAVEETMGKVQAVADEVGGVVQVEIENADSKRRKNQA